MSIPTDVWDMLPSKTDAEAIFIIQSINKAMKCGCGCIQLSMEIAASNKTKLEEKGYTIVEKDANGDVVSGGAAVATTAVVWCEGGGDFEG